MVLILSDNMDFSTNEVIDWLKYLGVNVRRVKMQDIILNDNINYKIEPNLITISFEGLPFNIDEVKSVWFRRWNTLDDFLVVNQNHDNTEAILSSIKSEYKLFYSYFFYVLRDRKWLTQINQIEVNKLISLDKALKAGFIVPKTLITRKLTDLMSFDRDTDNSIITKSIGENTTFKIENTTYSSYTSEMSIEDCLKQNETFALSLFQENLNKAYEVRTFYLQGEVFSMAIFSQSDDKTKTDFRHYNYKKPNRTVTYEHDKTDKEKIQKFMELSKLTTGSLDFVVTNSGELVFLEVNPVGQFGMVSYPCNYYLEEKIAHYLT